MVSGRSCTIHHGWRGALESARGSHTCLPALGAQDPLETVVRAGPICTLCLLLDHHCPSKSFVPMVGVPNTAWSWQGVFRQAAAPTAHGASTALLCPLLFLTSSKGRDGTWDFGKLNQSGASGEENVFIYTGCQAVPARAHGGMMSLASAHGVRLPRVWVCPDMSSFLPWEFWADLGDFLCRKTRCGVSPAQARINHEHTNSNSEALGKGRALLLDQHE